MGCTFHAGNSANDLQFFPFATGVCGTANFHCLCSKEYVILDSGTCETIGMYTIVEEAGCLQAGISFSGDATKGSRSDQPAGGYTTTGTGRTMGCTFHSGNSANDLQFFPSATGVCGTANFHCLCSKEYVILDSGTCETIGMYTIV